MVASAYTPSAAPRANGEIGRNAAEKRIGRKLVRYRRKWEAAFDTDGVVLPSRHLKGAEVLVDAVAATGDQHVIKTGSDWGELAHGAGENEEASVWTTEAPVASPSVSPKDTEGSRRVGTASRSLPLPLRGDVNGHTGNGGVLLHKVPHRRAGEP